MWKKRIFYSCGEYNEKEGWKLKFAKIIKINKNIVEIKQKSRITATYGCINFKEQLIVNRSLQEYNQNQDTYKGWDNDDDRRKNNSAQNKYEYVAGAACRKNFGFEAVCFKMGNGSGNATDR